MRRAAPALLASLVVAVAFAAAATGARGALVEVRVDTTAGATLYDGSVETSPHQVDGVDGTGLHPCSGDASASPSATATGALDDAMRAAGIGWRGNWDPSFRDFFIDRIGPYASAAPDSYWWLTVNGRFASGGCQAKVESGDLVHFTYGPAFGGGEPTAPETGTVPGTGSPGTGVTSGGSGAAARAPRVRAIGRRAAAYLHRHPGGAGSAWGRLALALRSGDGPGAAARALLGDRLDALRGDGSIAGDTNATATGVLALVAAQPQRARAAARWLARGESAAGGLGYRRGVAADVDTTALSTWALAFAGLDRSARRAARFVAATENADGGFPSIPGGESNSQSTGLALVALRLAGPGPSLRSGAGRTPLEYLASLARDDGSLEYALASRPTPTWTTAQALLGLTARSKLLVGGSGR